MEEAIWYEKQLAQMAETLWYLQQRSRILQEYRLDNHRLMQKRSAKEVRHRQLVLCDT
jgi:hypothetical protein